MTVRYQPTGGTASEISASVETGVRDGRLAAGQALPTVRALAGTLGVSPATVAAAYQALRQRGIVETAGRAGTRIRSRPSVAGARAAQRLPVPANVLDLSSGHPDARLLPDLAAALASVAADGATSGYGAAGPLPALTGLARAALDADGVPGGPVGVVGGSLDGIERVLGAHLRAGDRVAVEDPGWANLLDLVAALGLHPHPVPVDEAGPVPAGLAAALRAGVRAVIVTSRAHNPTGASVTAERAADLRAVLGAGPDVLVVEDDHSGELSAVPLHPLAGATGSWAFVRSVSKPYGPDLRLAVLAADEVTLARVEGRQRLGPGWVSTMLQRTVVALWTSPDVAALIGAARDSYESRRTALVAGLRARGLDAVGRTGINVWVPVPDETAAIARLRDDGYAVAPGAFYRLASPPAIRVTISRLDAERIGEFADAVARAARGVSAGHGA